MRGHVGGDTSFDGETEQVEVSDQVQYLVVCEFVGITEFRIDDVAFVTG